MRCMFSSADQDRKRMEATRAFRNEADFIYKMRWRNIELQLLLLEGRSGSAHSVVRVRRAASRAIAAAHAIQVLR